MNLSAMKTNQSVWEVSFVNQFTRFLVNADTLVDAVEEAKKIAAERNIPIRDLKRVDYLMY